MTGDGSFATDWQCRVKASARCQTLDGASATVDDRRQESDDSMLAFVANVRGTAMKQSTGQEQLSRPYARDSHLTTHLAVPTPIVAKLCIQVSFNHRKS